MKSYYSGFEIHTRFRPPFTIGASYKCFNKPIFLTFQKFLRVPKFKVLSIQPSNSYLGIGVKNPTQQEGPYSNVMLRRGGGQFWDTPYESVVLNEPQKVFWGSRLVLIPHFWVVMKPLWQQAVQQIFSSGNSQLKLKECWTARREGKKL